MRENISITERLVGVFTYFTFGMAGLIWLVYCILTKKNATSFASYHIYQSIFLSVFLYVISILCDIAFGLMVNLPFVGVFIKKLVVFFAGNPVYFGYSAVHFAIFIIILYLAFGSMFGKYSYFPGLSDIIKANIRR